MNSGDNSKRKRGKSNPSLVDMVSCGWRERGEDEGEKSQAKESKEI